MSKYAELLKDPRWQRKRLEILERDHWECQYCGDTEKTLHVHHKRYTWGKKPWEYDGEDLVTFCEDCHARATDCGKRAQRLLGEMSPGDLQKVIGYMHGLLAEGRPFDERIEMPDWETVLGVAQAWDLRDDEVMDRMMDDGRCHVTVGDLEQLRDATSRERNARRKVQ